MIKQLKYILLAVITVSFVACENDTIDDLRNRGQEDPVVLEDFTQGDADFSNYVSIGNSLTAGFTDNALFIAGQQNSTPNILAQQFASLGNGSEFTQPLMADNVGGILDNGILIAAPRLYFYLDTDSDEDACPYPNPSASGPSVVGVNPEDDTTSATLPTTTLTQASGAPFNNMGVPGAKSFHLLAPGYGDPSGVLLGTANPYFARMATSPTTTVLQDAIAQNPSFFTLWIGNNDVLGYALSGGESDATADNYDPITDLGTFTGAYTAIVQTLASTGAQGIIGNIPSLTAIPHFTTVPHNPLDPCNPSFAPQISTLNTIFGALNQVFTALGETNRLIEFSTSEASAVVINDETLTDISAQIAGALAPDPTFAALVQSFGLPAAAAPQVAQLLGLTYGQARQATDAELLVLPSSAVIGTLNEDQFAFLLSQGLTPDLAGQFAVEGITLPLADRWVLLPSEQTEIDMAISSFNDVIATAASAANFPTLDANMLLNTLSNTGIESNDFISNSQLVFGGAFSLDGVHPTARGYAIVANEFLKAIDSAYGSNFEASGNLVDISNYPTNYPESL